MSESRVQGKIFGPKRDKVLRRLHNEQLNYLYCSPNIMPVIKSRRMRRAGEKRGECRSWVGKT